MKWFERKFDFKNINCPFYIVLERLRGAPVRLEQKLLQAPADILSINVNNSWSIKENAGHLSDLETLWQDRLEDILTGQSHLREADLQNQKTSQANHNGREVKDIVSEFYALRVETIKKLEQLRPYQIELSALHPRLHTPMRVTDLFLFVAEHDDHHLSRITEIIKTS